MEFEQDMTISVFLTVICLHQKKFDRRMALPLRNHCEVPLWIFLRIIRSQRTYLKREVHPCLLTTITCSRKSSYWHIISKNYYESTPHSTCHWQTRTQRLNLFCLTRFLTKHEIKVIAHHSVLSCSYFFLFLKLKYLVQRSERSMNRGRINSHCSSVI